MRISSIVVMVMIVSMTVGFLAGVGLAVSIGAIVSKKPTVINVPQEEIYDI